MGLAVCVMWWGMGGGGDGFRAVRDVVRHGAGVC